MRGLLLLALPALLQAGCPGTPLRAAAERWAACTGMASMHELVPTVTDLLHASDWRERLTGLASRHLPGAVDCAVREAVAALMGSAPAEASIKVLALLPTQESRKTALRNGLQWLKEHP